MYARSQLKGDRHSSDNARKTFCIIMGDYGGSMGFATDLPFCTAYPLSFADKEDLAWMTFRSPQNHPTSFTADVLLVRQLLARDCPPHEYTRDRHVIGASLSPGEYISRLTSFHRSLFLTIMRHHTPTPGQEGRLHFSPWVHLQARTCYSLAQLGI